MCDIVIAVVMTHYVCPNDDVRTTLTLSGKFAAETSELGQQKPKDAQLINKGREVELRHGYNFR